MSLVKLSDLPEAPDEGQGKRIHLEHPFTQIKYEIGLFKSEGKYYAIRDACPVCGGSLGRGTLRGKYVFCSNEECGWNVKSGVCKFNRASVLPTYKVTVQDDGLFINI